VKGKKWLASLVLGLGLYLQHYFAYGGYDLEVWGHETLGIVMVLAGLFGFFYENLRNKTPVWDAKK